MNNSPFLVASTFARVRLAVQQLLATALHDRSSQTS
jgi:hypothetical protein